MYEVGGQQLSWSNQSSVQFPFFNLAKSAASCRLGHIIAAGIAAEANKDPGDVDTAAVWAVEFGFGPQLARVEQAIDFIGDVDRRVQRQRGNVRHPDRKSTRLNSSH